MSAYDPKFESWIKSLWLNRDDPQGWMRRVWVDFIGLCAVAALGAALFVLAGL